MSCFKMLMTICFVLIPISCGHEWPSCDKGGKNCEQVVKFHPFYGGWMPTYADKSMNNFLGEICTDCCIRTWESLEGVLEASLCLEIRKSGYMGTSLYGNIRTGRLGDMRTSWYANTRTLGTCGFEDKRIWDIRTESETSSQALKLR